MSFFSDPELFLVWGRTMGLKFFIFRIQRKPGCPVVPEDTGNYEVLNFSEHLSLPHNKESDYDNLFAYLTRNDKFVNCRGLVINWFTPNDQFKSSYSYSWSPELLNLSSYGIHALATHQENESDARDREKAEKLQALEKRVSDLHEQLNQEKNDKQGLEKSVSDLHEQLIKEKNDMQALEKRVSNLHEQLTKVESDIFFGWLDDNSCGTMSRTICNLYSHQRPRHASVWW